MIRNLTLLALSIVLQHASAQPIYNVAHINLGSTTYSEPYSSDNLDLAAVNDGFMTFCESTLCPIEKYPYPVFSEETSPAIVTINLNKIKNIKSMFFSAKEDSTTGYDDSSRGVQFSVGDTLESSTICYEAI